MHGFGNDFVIMEHHLKKHQIKFICDRKLGVGCDQLLIVEYQEDSLRMWTYNSDGSPAGFCGNGARCLVKLGRILNKFRVNQSITIFNGDDSLSAKNNKNKSVTINLGKPRNFSKNRYFIEQFLNAEEINSLNLCRTEVPYLNIGNSHLMIFVNNFDFDIKQIGKKIQSNYTLFPDSINVNFVHVLDERTIKVRTFERGVGLTSACGSGASASAFTARSLEIIFEDSIKVQFEKPEDFLCIEINNDEIIMTGSCSYVFKGELCLENKTFDDSGF